MTTQVPHAPSSAIHYRTVAIAGIDIFYREAGDPKAPTILLLHGFPTEAYRKDLKHVEFHMLNAGHFALESNAPEIADFIRGFQALRE
jgi:pimeloyl-ACP methyl ester carboxylesterase